MGLRLKMTSRHRQSLGERATKEFGHKGGTIGRSLESDWVLPDSQRYISSRHASIDYRSGSYYIVDTSTNGVYVNDSDTPVGRGNPQRLFSGDRIRLGEYEMVVEVEDEASTTEHLMDSSHVDPVARRQRVEPPDPTGADLVQAHEITAVGIELLISEEAETEAIKHAQKLRAANLRLEEDPPPKRVEKPIPGTNGANPAAAPAAPAERPAAPRAREPAAQKPPQKAVAGSLTAAGSLLASTGANPRVERPAAGGPAPRTPFANTPTAAPPGGAAPPAAAPPASSVAAPPASAAAVPPASAAVLAPTAPPRGATSSVLDAFFRGAGLSTQRLDERQVEAALHLLGQLMREVIVGLGESLHLRAEQKNAMRIPNTTIQPHANNPLKFSAGVEEALHNLLFRQSAEYMPAVDAVREAFVDVKLHQQCVMNALRAALSDYVGRLDPEDLENKFTSGKRSGIMNAANKLKYWDLFKDLYQVVTQQAAGQLPQLFVEDLARAYEHESSRSGGSNTRKPQAKLVS